MCVFVFVYARVYIEWGGVCLVGACVYVYVRVFVFVCGYLCVCVCVCVFRCV